MATPRGGEWLDGELRALRAANLDVLVCALSREEVTALGLRRPTRTMDHPP